MEVHGSGSPKHKATRFTRLNLATAGFIVAWVAFACYAIPYLISH
jgi:hypothetical protein